MILFYCGLGQQISKRIPLPQSFLLSAPIGFSIAAIFSSIFYKLGIALSYQCIFLGIVSFLNILIERKSILKNLKTNLTIYSVGLAVSFFLLLPYYTGGPQFYSFQGNHWDNFSYLGSSISYSKDSFEFLKSTPENELVNKPIALAGKRNLSVRPSINITHALTSFFSMSSMIDNHYIFLCSLWLLTFNALLFGLITFFKFKFSKSTLVAMAFVLGFFGQYIFDINAWSHMGAFSLILSLNFLAFCFVRNKNNLNFYFYLSLVILGGGVLYIYPEILLFHGPFFVALLGYGIYTKKLNLIDSTKILGTFGCVLILGLFFYEGSIGFIIRQFTESNSSQNTFWTYFQKYFFGQGDLLIDLKTAAENTFIKLGFDNKEEAIKNIHWPTFVKDFFFSGNGLIQLFVLAINLLAGFFGLYFITPIHNLGTIQLILWSLTLALFLISLKYSIFKNIKNYIKNLDFQLLLLYLTILLSICSIFILKKQLWSLGKALTYISPFLFILISYSYLKEVKLFKNISLIYIFLNIIFGLYRPLAAMNENGIHYSYPPYPSIHDGSREVKLNYDLSLRDLRKKIKSCKGISVDVKNLWAREHVFFYLYEHDIPFTSDLSIWSYVDTENDLGHMKKIATDCVLNDDFILTYSPWINPGDS